MIITPQKGTARPHNRRYLSAVIRLGGILAAAIGMGVVGYLIAQGYDGLFTATLSSSLTTVSILAFRKSR